MLTSKTVIVARQRDTKNTKNYAQCNEKGFAVSADEALVQTLYLTNKGLGDLAQHEMLKITVEPFEPSKS